MAVGDPVIPASTRDLVATVHEGRAEAPSSTLPNRFRVDDELGRGGINHVVGALDRQLAREVAIKEIASTEPALLARFEREIRITARLQHPSIVPLYDAGYTTTGTPYYVMRRLSGRSLAERIASAGTLDERLALLPSFLAAADAIGYAHARGIIHRDIKPTNIVLGEHGECVVIDWGLAKQLDVPDEEDLTDRPVEKGLTRVGVVMGRPASWAPSKSAARPRIVGVMCSRSARRSTTSWRTRSPLPTMRSRAACRASSSRSSIRRSPPTRIGAMPMAPLAADLRRFLEGRLVAAHRYSFGERVRRFVRRHAVAVAIAGIATAAIATTIAIALNSVVSERDRAQRGWASAADRADELLLSRAEAILDGDPTRAALLAATLDVRSPRWPRARTILVAARRGGIARRIGKHDDVVAAMRVSGERVATLDRRGEIVVHDRASSQTIASIPGASADHRRCREGSARVDRR